MNKIIFGKNVNVGPQDLTGFDLMSARSETNRLLIFDRPMDPRVLIRGLEEILTVYPYFSGRLIGIETDNPRIEASNRGAIFIYNYYDEDIKPYGLDCPLKPEFEPDMYKYINDIDTYQIDENTPTLQLKLSVFRNGSILSFAYLHALADGDSMWNFILNWGKACRGITLDQNPDFDRNTLIDMAAVDGPELPNIFPVDNESVDSNKMNSEIVTRVFRLDHQFVSQILDNADPFLGIGERYSRQDLIMAYTWKVIASCQDQNDDSDIGFGTVYNLRKLVDLSPTYFGVALSARYFLEKKKNVLNSSEVEIARRIRAMASAISIEDVSNELGYWRDRWHSRGNPQEYKILNGITMYNNQAKFPIYEVDFGFGTPIWVDIPYISKSSREVDIFSTPQMDGGVDCHVTLPAKEMSKFNDRIFSSLTSKLH